MVAAGRLESGVTSQFAVRHHVRVWFGENIVAQKVCSSSAAADRYEAGMKQRFQSLRVTNEPVSSR